MKNFNGKEKNFRANLIKTWESIVLAYREFTKKPSGRMVIKLFFLILKIIVEILLKRYLPIILF